MTRIIVCDTAPLFHLSYAGAIHLWSLADEILIPTLGAVEFKAYAQGWSPSQWVMMVNLEKSARHKVEKWVKARQIDPAEADAIGFALQELADWLLR